MKTAKKTAHTPGPWRAVERDRTTVDVVSEDFGAITSVTDYPHNAHRILPDARLIAAAPELLAACEALLEMAEFNGEQFAEDIDAVDLARAAVAKARGAA